MPLIMNRLQLPSCNTHNPLHALALIVPSCRAPLLLAKFYLFFQMQLTHLLLWEVSCTVFSKYLSVSTVCTLYVLPTSP